MFITINISKTEILKIGYVPDASFRHSLNFVNIVKVLGTYVVIGLYSAQLKKSRRNIVIITSHFKYVENEKLNFIRKNSNYQIL